MIAILYPLKMDKNLSEAYSKIYEMRTSLDDYGTPEKRQAAKDQVEINKKVNKYGGKTPSGTSAVDAKKGLDDTINSSHEPEGTMVEGQKYGLTKGTGKASGAYKKYLENAKKMQEADKKKKKTGNPAFDDPSHHSFAKYKTRNEGKFRSEWEELKLMEMKDYVSEFDVWLTGLIEEGYDIDRWSDEDMFETFINEHNLWGVKETVLEALATIEESDKKGKGSGSKDACYHKVKSRYSVWPSAYASGALVKCRKKGAKNWGNSSKKEGFSNWRDDLGLLDENRATAYTAGMSDQQKDVEMRKISPKVAKEAGKSHDRFMFKSRKKGGKFNKDYNKNVLKDKKYNQNTTGRGTPVSYRKGYGDEDLGRYQSKIRQGEGSIKDLGKKK
tara:strand:- start:134 stop:1291 length:1158 start_codon:yes stop_codon:yes gene_type:complete